MALYRIEDKIPGFRSGPLMPLGIFVKKKGGGWITNEIESRWWESSFHLYGYAIKDSGFLGTLKEKIIYYHLYIANPKGPENFHPFAYWMLFCISTMKTTHCFLKTPPFFPSC